MIEQKQSFIHSHWPCGLQGECSINLTHLQNTGSHTQRFLFLYVWFCISNQVPEDVHVQINGPSLGTANNMQNLYIETLL